MKLVISISTLLLCSDPTLVRAQGVPTQDNAGLGQLISVLSQLKEDMDNQRAQLGTGDTLSAVQSDQLRVLDAMSAALTGPGLDIRALEGNADFPASEVYPITSNTPMDHRLFGEGRETVEMMIVRVAGEYAGAPGVRRAGLTATQWRCLFQALIKQESRFRVTEHSTVGAYDLTQLMP